LNTPETLGERISTLRGNITQSEFSLAIGISQNSLCRYERNQRMPKASIINQICQVTGASHEWLISGQGDMYAEGPVAPIKPATDLPPSPNECPRCAKLEQELKQEREERREVSAENRQLHRDKEKLLLENAELRERLARLERIQAAHRLDAKKEEGFPSLFDEQPPLQSSSHAQRVHK